MSISYDEYREAELLASAALLGMDEEVLSYAKQIQRQLGSDGDEAFWLDCLEMSYNELIKGM
jgi:LmbE family N-acetylglucosaminyl deacetylase